MFSKLFGKKQPPAQRDTQPESRSAAPKSAGQSTAPADTRVIWAAKLQACLGDDAALLALAREAPLVDIKQSAIEALVAEESLRLAESEFRTLNQRVHRFAKQRYQSLVAQRENRAQASLIIEQATALVQESMVPANRLVELDQAWKKLNADLLGDELRNAYTALSTQLSTQLRERGDQRLAISRWTTRTKETLQQFDAIFAAVDAGTSPESELAAAAEAAQTALASQPANVGTNAGANASTTTSPTAENILLENACRDALQRAAELPARLLEKAAQEKAREEAEAAAQKSALESSAESAKKSPSKSATKPDLSGHIQSAESALAEGHLNETRKHLMAIDHALGDGHGHHAISAPLRKRLESVQAEYARLKGWQHWGGGRVREDLLDEAEALAKGIGLADATPENKISVKPLAETIEQLRTRWKDLDHLGGAGGKALWPRFDAALKAAYVPVAAQQAKLKAAREENLTARQNLIAQLDGLQVMPTTDGGAPDWREMARALEHFESEWRKLGPAEHTVPNKAREALLERRAASLARIESPLQEARRIAQTEREKLIARAKALGTDGRARDSVTRVRELQAAWQQHAKTLPLARGIENKLWAEFKAATDAVFKLREAEFAARDAESRAQQATREALIVRLNELNSSLTPAEVERAIASIDREWRNAGEAPSAAAGGLDERFRTARTAALQRMTDARQQVWHASCDSLLNKLALCESIELNDENSATGQAHDGIILRLEAALDIPSPPAYQPARRELKLRALKDAMEGRTSGDAKVDDIGALLNDALYQAQTAPQRDRLQTILSTLRERPAIPIGPHG